MQIQKIPYAQTNYFSQLVLDYVAETNKIRPFYEFPCNLQGIEQAVEQLQTRYTVDMRQSICQILAKQYHKLLPNATIEQQLQLLAKTNTLTVTTAHQPNIFGGPLYIVYKILAIIRLCQQLNQHFPDHHFVPIYWMGSEDHDFEEINHIHLFNQKLQWQQTKGGAVGRLGLETLQNTIQQLLQLLGDSHNAQQIQNYIDKSYSTANDLATATQLFLHQLFGEYGLLIIQQDDPQLKQHFASTMEAELLNATTFALAQQTNQQLAEQQYHQQAFARSINLFYLTDGKRERIVWNEEQQYYSTEQKQWQKNEILNEIRQFPEHFSPNVFLRPTYQQTVLPNVIYIGGGGEIAYWLQQKEIIQNYGAFYPVLVLRPSVLWVDATNASKLQKLDLTPAKFFQPIQQIITDYVAQHSPHELDLSREKTQLEQLFAQIQTKATTIEPSLQDSVAAEASKMFKSIENLEQKLRRAEKRKHDTAIEQIQHIQQKLFPNNSLQERYDNFIPFYLKYGKAFFDTLLQYFDPLEKHFLLIVDGSK